MTIAAIADRSDASPAFMDGLLLILPAAQRLAYGMLQSAGEAEDAVQEATLKAWRAQATFREGADMRPWFLRIVANECKQRRRNRWWSVLKAKELPEAPARASDSSEDAIELRLALSRLPPDMRLVLVLRFYLDLAFDEIAGILGCSAPAAKSRTHRALGRLRVEVPKELGR